MSDAATMSDTVSLDAAIHEAVQRLGLTSLKDKQLDAVRSFAMQQDTVVALPILAMANPLYMLFYHMSSTS